MGGRTGSARGPSGPWALGGLWRAEPPSCRGCPGELSPPRDTPLLKGRLFGGGHNGEIDSLGSPWEAPHTLLEWIPSQMKGNLPHKSQFRDKQTLLLGLVERPFERTLPETTILKKMCPLGSHRTPRDPRKCYVRPIVLHVYEPVSYTHLTLPTILLV